MLTRRRLLTHATLAACACTLPETLRAAPVEDRLRDLEAAGSGRLGVAMLNTASGARLGYRADERFPMCSTAKMLTVAAMLASIDRRQDHLDRMIVFGRRNLVSNSPVTSQKIGPPGVSIRELCEAAITVSDNTAMNLLLEEIGGPPGWTAYARSIGDTVSRLDRNEPDLNESIPGDPRDTTSPAAMLQSMRRVILGDALSPASRQLLAGWMSDAGTGNAKIRAGVPAAWRVADKTGSSGRGTSNDIAVIWPTNTQPWLLTVFLTGSHQDEAQQAAVAANVARLCVATL